MQAETYSENLKQTFELLAEFPGLARERIELTPPVRIHPCGSHVNVYLVMETRDVLIVRLRYGREDWTSDPTRLYSLAWPLRCKANMEAKAAFETCACMIVIRMRAKDYANPSAGTAKTNTRPARMVGLFNRSGAKTASHNRPHHSWRRASIGFIRAARRAGK